MFHDKIIPCLVVALMILLTACEQQAPPRVAEPAFSCEASEVQAVVLSLGERLKLVPLLAPDSVLVREIREAYEPYVTPELLQTWLSDPASAPGQHASSPWPDRIEIQSVKAAEPGVCRVAGDVVYLTSTEVATGEAAHREPVILYVTNGDAWLINRFEQSGVLPGDSTDVLQDTMPAASDASATLRRYYNAIDAGNFREAYLLWGDSGAASGQSYEAFTSGFDDTERVEVELGEPGRVEPAAGSRYVEVPVVVRAVTRSGVDQQFEGTYTLRRSVVDGAPEDERRWHIYRADIRQTW